MQFYKAGQSVSCGSSEVKQGFILCWVHRREILILYNSLCSLRRWGHVWERLNGANDCNQWRDGAWEYRDLLVLWRRREKKGQGEKFLSEPQSSWRDPTRPMRRIHFLYPVFLSVSFPESLKFQTICDLKKQPLLKPPLSPEAPFLKSHHEGNKYPIPS